MAKILVVEDEAPISDLVCLNLNMAGFETIQAMDGQEGLGYIKNQDIDLVILDIMLPKMDGYELVPHITARKIPVIMLTAKCGLKDRVIGLNMGADDYIPKPFEGIELIARVNAVLRRSGKGDNVQCLKDIKIYPDRRKVIKDGKEVELTAKEFELLCFMVSNKGIALSREVLLERVWGYDFDGGTRTVDMHIQKIRSKIDTLRIETVYKLGYRLEA